jgi:hypothetical protein
MLNPVVVDDPFVEEEVRGGLNVKKHATLACHINMECLC